MLVVDAANVIGSRPDGWWRDRAAAAQRFVETVRGAVDLGALEPPVVVVLEGQARKGSDALELGGVEVVHAAASGDDDIVAIAAARGGATVVTADRALAERVRSVGGEVVGPGWLLGRLGR